MADNHHHHVQLRGHVDGQQNRQQRQDYPLTPAGGVGASLYGRARHFTRGFTVLFPGNIHRGDVHQDSGDGLHPPRELLPQEYVEHHGLRGGGVWVRTAHYK